MLSIENELKALNHFDLFRQALNGTIFDFDAEI